MNAGRADGHTGVTPTVTPLVTPPLPLCPSLPRLSTSFPLARLSSRFSYTLDTLTCSQPFLPPVPATSVPDACPTRSEASFAAGQASPSVGRDALESWSWICGDLRMARLLLWCRRVFLFSLCVFSCVSQSSDCAPSVIALLQNRRVALPKAPLFVVCSLVCVSIEPRTRMARVSVVVALCLLAALLACTQGQHTTAQHSTRTRSSQARNSGST